jgi:hypothetical protein
MSRQTNSPSVKDTDGNTETPSAINITGNSIKNVLLERNPITREIHSCLTPCSQCSGVYVDAINGNMLRIICSHQCHSTTNKVKRAANTK